MTLIQLTTLQVLVTYILTNYITSISITLQILVVIIDNFLVTSSQFDSQGLLPGNLVTMVVHEINADSWNLDSTM